MKLSTGKSLPPSTSGYSDRELIRQIEHYFPKMPPRSLLGTLLERFKERVDVLPDTRDPIEEPRPTVKETSCPQCGIELLATINPEGEGQ